MGMGVGGVVGGGMVMGYHTATDVGTDMEADFDDCEV